MKKKILINVTIHMVIGSAVLCLLGYYIFGIVDDASVAKLVSNTFSSLKNQIEISQSEVDNMIKQFGEDNTAKAKALAIIIYQNDNSLTYVDSLEEVRVALDADEILVTDEKGNVVISTTPFADYNISSHTIFKNFVPGLTDRSYTQLYSVIDDYKVTQYVCCSKFNHDGVVIMKIDTKYVSKSVKYAGISNVLSGQSFVTGGNIFVIDRESWRYLSHTDAGKTWKDVQFDKDKFIISDDEIIRNFSVTDDNVKSEMYYQNYDGNIICITLPKSKIYLRRNYVCVSILVAMVVITVIGFLALRNKLIQYKQHIIEKIKMK